MKIREFLAKLLGKNAPEDNKSKEIEDTINYKTAVRNNNENQDIFNMAGDRDDRERE